MRQNEGLRDGKRQFTPKFVPKMVKKKKWQLIHEREDTILYGIQLWGYSQRYAYCNMILYRVAYLQ